MANSENKNKDRTVLAFSLPLATLIIIGSCVGLLTPGFYSKETSNWQAQSTGQDLIDLVLIVPALLISSVFAYRGNRPAMEIWGGVMLYCTYTFMLYCFDVHFNQLFIFYCACLGLSFYSLLYFLFQQRLPHYPQQHENKPVVRFIAIYFIFISIIFYTLWLLEIVPNIFRNTWPKSIADTGLFTNGVHVLDLSVFLPAVLFTGIFLLKGKSLGYILTPAILTFFILMDITIGMLAVVMKMKGIESSLVLTGVMGMLALISLILLVLYLKDYKFMLEK